MACDIPFPQYNPPSFRGLKHVNSYGDGYSVDLEWRLARPSSTTYNVIYNLYYSQDINTIFTEGPKFVSLNSDELKAVVLDFFPGQLYFFAVRATQYNPSWFNPNQLPIDPGQLDENLRLYPETLLSQNISDEEMIIQINDVEIFPPYGVIVIGKEIISYSNKDEENGYLIADQRGFLGTAPTQHDVDGYDGYEYRDPIVYFWKGFEEKNTFIQQEEVAINDISEAYTLTDGYKVLNLEGTLTTDLSATDEDRTDFLRYDFVGWHRTPPEDLLKGNCVDSYFGGEYSCADGANGINNQIRNISIEDRIDQLLEVKLEQIGEPVILLRRIWNGIVDSSYQHNTQYPDPRGINNYGTQYNTGYEQYFYPRRSDRRILVHFEPAEEDLKTKEEGLELELNYSCWSLAAPIIRDFDVIIRFNIDGTEDARFEVQSVTRNKTFYGQSGMQKFKANRLRKTDDVYKWRAVRDVASFPSELETNIGMLRGAGTTMIPHIHNIVVNENITSVYQINQTTSHNQGHSHAIINGVVQPSFGHTHEIEL